MWKPWRRRLATGGVVPAGSLVQVGEFDRPTPVPLADAEPVAEMYSHRPPPIDVRIGVVSSQAEFVEMVRRAVRRSGGMP